MTYAPIALFCYRRIDVLEQTIEALKKNIEAQDSLLFIFSDGYKNEEDKQGVLEVREYIKKISGFKEIKIIESQENKGLANSIIEGVTNIVNQFGKIIVIEDDILTSPYFLKYMNDSLDMYQDNEQVGSITGYGFEIKNMPETYFLKRFDCWGWATWKRSWDLFEKDGQKLLNAIVDSKREFEFDCNNSQEYVHMLKNQISGKNNSWAIRMYASQFINNKLQLHPGVSMTRNIGFGPLATHCTWGDERFNVKILSRPIQLRLQEVKEDKKTAKKCFKYFNWLSEPYVKKNFKYYLDQIFSIKNYYKNDVRYKGITILGLKFSFENPKKDKIN